MPLCMATAQVTRCAALASGRQELPALTAEHQTWPDGLVSRHAGRQLAVRR